MLGVAKDGSQLDDICRLLGLRNDPETAASVAALLLDRGLCDGLVNALTCGKKTKDGTKERGNEQQT